MYQSAGSAVSLATAGSDRGHARATHSTQLVREPVSLPGRHRVRSGSPPCQKKPGGGGGCSSSERSLPSCSARSHVRVAPVCGVDLKGAMYRVNGSLHAHQEREYVYIMVRVCSCVSRRSLPAAKRYRAKEENM